MKNEMTNIEVFLSFVGAGNMILAIAFSNWFLGAITVLCGMFVGGAVLMRNKQRTNLQENK